MEPSPDTRTPQLNKELPVFKDTRLFNMIEIGSILSGLISILFTALIIPYWRRQRRLYAEQREMIQRTLMQNTGVMIFGHFGKQVQSEFLGDFLTSLFGEVLFDIITEWNKDHHRKEAIVMPANEAQAVHMRYLASAKASSFILQSHGLGRYFRNAQLHGTPEYQFCKVLVAIACPKPDRLTSHDHPRLIAIEEGALKRIAADRDTLPQWDTQDGHTWVAVLRELAEDWEEGEQNGIAVLEIPVDLPGTQHPTNLMPASAESAGSANKPTSALTV